MSVERFSYSRYVKLYTQTVSMQTSENICNDISVLELVFTIYFSFPQSCLILYLFYINIK